MRAIAGGIFLGLAMIVNAQEPSPIRLLTLEPGHFHAAMFHREMLPGVAPEVHVYAPPGPDLRAHLQRLAQFNARVDNPTRWQVEVHSEGNPLERLLAERRGNVAVLSGNNRGKIDRINALVGQGLHVLADKPWIIEPEDFLKLQAALDTADAKHVAAYDAMTQRFEVSCLLARALVNDPEVFGQLQTGSAHAPAVRMESVHYFLKEVAGAPLQRLGWFFDVRQQGEGLADVGTHLVDLVQWTLFPDAALDYNKDVVIHSGRHWPTRLTQAQFQRVTGETAFPAGLQPALREGALECFANNRVEYRLRGVWVRLDILWELEAAPGAKDSELAIFEGERSRIAVRQGAEEKYVPEVFVFPQRPELKPAVLAALQRRVAALQNEMPGLKVEEQNERLRIMIPAPLRVSHEAHFGLLSRRFLDYVRDPARLPAWEKPNMLAKYFVTTQGVKLARENPVKSKP